MTQKFDSELFYDAEFVEHRAVAEATHRALKVEFTKLLAQAVATIRGGGKIMFFGNGGSASDAQHLATEFTVRYVKNRPALAALALTTDASALTAIPNDIGFHRTFSRQIEALGKPGDLVVGITTSGESSNVLEAFRVAKKLGVFVACLTGKTGGEAKALADICLVVPSNTTAPEIGKSFLDEITLA